MRQVVYQKQWDRIQGGGNKPPDVAGRVEKQWGSRTLGGGNSSQMSQEEWNEQRVYGTLEGGNCSALEKSGGTASLYFTRPCVKSCGVVESPPPEPFQARPTNSLPSGRT
jgi:hypothetical protein